MRSPWPGGTKIPDGGHGSGEWGCCSVGDGKGPTHSAVLDAAAAQPGWWIEAVAMDMSAAYRKAVSAIRN